MSPSAGTAGTPSALGSNREQIEADVTGVRVFELELNPVQGRFDAEHLREVNRRIFQDMPGRGFHDVTPGVYRPEAPAGQDWLKNRSFTTFDGSFLVAYSSMDALARQRIAQVLQDAKPEHLAQLDQASFSKKIAQLYSQLDYLHPFSDGNSRTLRTFTRQLARAAGYELAWEKFNVTPDGRDKLYIARDLSVNEIALPNMHSHRAMVGVSHAMHSLAGNPNLEKLLVGAIRPLNDLSVQLSSSAPTAPTDLRSETAVVLEFERAMEVKSVPESIRPALRAAFNKELEVRIARGEFARAPLAPRTGRSNPDAVDPKPSTEPKPKP